MSKAKKLREQVATGSPSADGASRAVARRGEVPAWFALAALAGAVWVVYFRTLDAPFIFDDLRSIVANPTIVRLWPLWGDGELLGPFSPLRNSPVAGRPLANFSLALNYHFSELNPRGYHVFNIMVHVLSAFLLWAIVGRTLRLPCFGGRFDRVTGVLALSVAVVWAVHPLQTEAVVYITQRTELLMALFYLATLYASLRYWAAATLVARRTWLLLATIACLAGAASKEVMVSAPVIVLLFERTFLRDSFRAAWRQSWPLYLGLAASWGLSAVLQFSAPHSDTAGFAAGVAAVHWWFTQTKVLLMYLKLATWPWPLVLHYDMPYLTTLREAWAYVILAAVFALATLALIWRRHAAGFLAACVFAVLAPTLVVPITTEIAAERRMYLPLAAFITLAVVGGYCLLEKLGRQRSGVAVVLALALIGGFVSANRVATYRDALTLWRDTVAHQPDNSLAHNNLGKELESLGQSEEAMQHFRDAIRLKPDFADAHFNLANLLSASGQPTEALEHYDQVLQASPDYVEAYGNMAAVYLQLNHPAQARAAAESGLDVARSTGQTATADRLDAWINDNRQQLLAEPASEASQ